MKKLKFAFSVLAVALALTIVGQSALVKDAAAQDRTTTTESTTTEKASTASTDKLRTVAPSKAHMVVLKLKTAGGTTETTCCTHWNTSTGGTGCASFPDECPAGQFKVDCGANGCW